jgi:hypothetical protein
VAEDHEGWVARSRVMLTPIAAPSIMGLSGFAMVTVMLGAYQAGWYGSAATPQVIWPLALFAGGVMQGIAAVAALRARDGAAAVAAHTAASAVTAAGAMVLEHYFGRALIPAGHWSRNANIPGTKITDPIAYPAGMPGVRVGQ